MCGAGFLMDDLDVKCIIAMISCVKVLFKYRTGDKSFVADFKTQFDLSRADFKKLPLT